MPYFHLPHGVPVLESLADHLLLATRRVPEALSRAIVFLPTRRAARALGAAFLRQGQGRALLLPRMVAIGDLDANPLFLSLADDLPIALPALVREAALARRIQEQFGDRQITPDRALQLAADLAALLDEAEEAECDLAGLKRLAPDDFARHWQVTLEFLEVATVWWRGEEARRGAGSTIARRLAMLRRLPDWLAREAAEAMVVAVGVVSAAPAQAVLLAAIAALRHGTVLLPGLDAAMPDRAWDELGPSHPQAEYKAFLALAGVARNDVAPWPHAPVRPAARAALLHQALRPAAALDWHAAPAAEACRGLSLMVAPDSATEARAIALAVREALEQPQHRVAVITPDRALAERVAAALARWNIAVADSAATPLSRTPPGALLRLVAEAVARNLAPVPLLSLLRHPLAAGGMAPEAFRRAGRNFELAALRGVRPDPRAIFGDTVLTQPGARPTGEEEGAGRPPAGWPRDREIRQLQQAVQRALEPLQRLFREPRAAPQELLRATVAAAESLAATDRAPGARRLWSGPEGVELARHVAAAEAALAELAPVAPRWWPELLQQLLARAAVRTRASQGATPHPRVELLGVLEARLLRHDVAILAGLNEGTWPASPDPGPWLSREQRTRLGLGSPDRAIGFAAADFTAAVTGADRVILARAEKVEGEPAVASRWLTRLTALSGELLVRRADAAGESDHAALAQLLDRPPARRAELRPEPVPPLDRRPRELFVTTVESLVKNPYAVYAAQVLKLRPLNPLDQEADAADWGSLVHQVAAEFAGWWQQARPQAAAAHQEFLRLAEAALIQENPRPALQALWRPRLATLAPWFVAHLAGRDGQTMHTECSGTITLADPIGPFRLSARADRIDVGPDGGVQLFDYKTGTVPTQANVRAGKAPQLTLTALIAAEGGFAAIGPARVDAFCYIKLSGGPDPGKLCPAVKDAERDAAVAAAGRQLDALLLHYADPESAYRARDAEDDYAHLSRRAGWSVAGNEAEEDAA